MSVDVIYSEVVFVKKNEVDNNDPDQCQFGCDIIQTPAKDHMGVKQTSQKTKLCGCDCARLFLMVLCALLTGGLIAFSFQYIYAEKKLQDLQQLHSALHENFTAISAELQEMHHRQQNLSKVLNEGACPKDWEYDGGKCYLFSTNKLDWMRSRDSCISDGGHLVIINNKNEQDFLMRIVKMKRQSFWIGLTDEKEEGQWLWMDNTELSESIRYWIITEPDNWKGQNGEVHSGEDCAVISPDYSWYRSWNDAFCSKSFRRICETRSSREM